MTGFVKQKFIRYHTSYKDANEELFSHCIITAGEGDSKLRFHHLGVKRRNQRPAWLRTGPGQLQNGIR